jgi:predicted aspartyl protease
MSNKLYEKEFSSNKVKLSKTSDYFIIKDIILNNSADSLNFLFDTGANITVIDKEIVDKANFKTVGFKKTVDVSNKINFNKIVNIKSLKIGNIQLSNIKAVVMDLKNSLECDSFQGIIGTDLSRNFVWFLDKNKGYAIMNPSDSLKKQYSKSVPLLLRHQLPYITAGVSGKQITFLFDTGAIEISLNTKDTLLINNTKKINYDSFWKSPNSSKPTSKEIKLLKNNIIELPDSNIKLNTDLTFQENGKRLWGNRAFYKIPFILDFKNKYILFHESLEEILSSPENTTLFFSISYNKVIIKSILKESSVFKKGLRVGDIVVAVNNTDIGMMGQNLCNVVDSLNKTRSEIKTITVSRKNGIVTFSL